MQRVKNAGYIISAVCVGMLLVSCGGSRDGATGDVLDVVASEASGSHVVLAVTGSTAQSGISLAKDAASTSNGNGTHNGSTGATSITDTSSSSCDFTFAGTSVNGHVDVVSDANNCTTLNSCIVCTAAPAGNDCTLSCAGDVPSNATIAADSITLTWTMTTDFTTDMPAADGAIRVDGSVTDWDDFVPDGASVTVDYDLAGCDGSGGVLEATANDPLSIGVESGGVFRESFAVADVGDGNCQLVTSIEADVPLTGVEVGGTTVDLSGDSASAAISAQAKICDLGANSGQCPE